MVTKNIMLSKKDAGLLEDVIVRYGRIVSFDQVKETFNKAYSTARIKARVSLLTELGWLVRLKTCPSPDEIQNDPGWSLSSQ